MILWFIAAFTAYFVKGLCGFANTLVFTTILSFGTANASISPVDLLLGYPANVILTWKNRRNLDPGVFLSRHVQGFAESLEHALDDVVVVFTGQNPEMQIHLRSI